MSYIFESEILKAAEMRRQETWEAILAKLERGRVLHIHHDTRTPLEEKVLYQMEQEGIVECVRVFEYVLVEKEG